MFCLVNTLQERSKTDIPRRQSIVIKDKERWILPAIKMESSSKLSLVYLYKYVPGHQKRNEPVWNRPQVNTTRTLTATMSSAEDGASRQPAQETESTAPASASQAPTNQTPTGPWRIVKIRRRHYIMPHTILSHVQWLKPWEPSEKEYKEECEAALRDSWRVLRRNSPSAAPFIGFVQCRNHVWLHSEAAAPGQGAINRVLLTPPKEYYHIAEDRATLWSWVMEELVPGSPPTREQRARWEPLRYEDIFGAVYPEFGNVGQMFG
ncbi:uncharacterized protein BO97DRAFT_444518 [Aspergillus homomorphus CBS 101889]|uniref:Uncharacterized protein n=1 Tax=Aspergillus homomorphus (strain CBS 101889) TaxID=1450537 RepID=A0A395HRG8_ASPHC|nr:hypothetical protein BO97DRAFT_444518 [Aspergillus homomorphus CBS 101889]RAL10542.1 hypothetical protein BO97DRAFT_444518 [Aspergillus homomorphus CBS 101889]